VRRGSFRCRHGQHLLITSSRPRKVDLYSLGPITMNGNVLAVFRFQPR
jgi:hypothetical protein